MSEPENDEGRRLASGLGPAGPVFEVQATDGAARAGVLRTAHGEVRTPVFMPVGTKGTVKSLHPDEVRDLGAADPARQHLPPAFQARATS